MAELTGDPHANCGSFAYQQVHCDRCGRDFTCTPWDDFYCAADGDHCCERCLLGGRPLVEVVEMSRDEWHAAVEAALAALGLTYEQLAEQARRWDFSSLQAQKLWLVIGTAGTQPRRGREADPDNPNPPALRPEPHRHGSALPGHTRRHPKGPAR